MTGVDHDWGGPASESPLQQSVQNTGNVHKTHIKNHHVYSNGSIHVYTILCSD